MEVASVGTERRWGLQVPNTRSVYRVLWGVWWEVLLASAFVGGSWTMGDTRSAFVGGSWTMGDTRSAWSKEAVWQRLSACGIVLEEKGMGGLRRWQAVSAGEGWPGAGGGWAVLYLHPPPTYNGGGELPAGVGFMLTRLLCYRVCGWQWQGDGCSSTAPKSYAAGPLDAAGEAGGHQSRLMGSW